MNTPTPVLNMLRRETEEAKHNNTGIPFTATNPTTTK